MWSLARSRAAGEYRYCARPRWSTPVACTDALASVDAHTSTHAGGITSRRNRSRTAGSSTEPPTSSTHLSGRAVIRWSPGGRKVRGVGSVRLREPLTSPERSGRRPPRDSQLSESENDPAPTRARDKLPVSISNIVNVERLNSANPDTSVSPTSLAFFRSSKYAVIPVALSATTRKEIGPKPRRPQARPGVGRTSGRGRSVSPTCSPPRGSPWCRQSSRLCSASARNGQAVV